MKESSAAVAENGRLLPKQLNESREPEREVVRGIV